MHVQEMVVVLMKTQQASQAVPFGRQAVMDGVEDMASWCVTTPWHDH